MVTRLHTFVKTYQTAYLRNLRLLNLNYLLTEYSRQYFPACASLGTLNWSLKALTCCRIPKPNPMFCCHAGSGKQMDPLIWLHQCCLGIPGGALMTQRHHGVEKGIYGLSCGDSFKIKCSEICTTTAREEVMKVHNITAGKKRGEAFPGIWEHLSLWTGAHVLPCDTACTWHRMVIDSSSVLSPSTWLRHFLNWNRHGLWSGLCFYTRLSDQAWHLKIRFPGPQNQAHQIFWTKYWEKCLKKDVCATFEYEELPKGHNLDARLMELLIHF